MSFHIKYPDDEIVGQQFGRLIVTGIAQPKKGMKHFKCQCFCGNKCVANKYLLLYGKKKSCGCLKDKTVYAKVKQAICGVAIKNCHPDTGVGLKTAQKIGE